MRGRPGPRETSAGLAKLFERTWEHATPLGMERPRRSGDELTGQEKAVMRLLADGLTDEVIARRLGVSIRTGRRVTAELMARLSARSRGVVAGG